ncbi:HD domain-containing protein [Microbacterium sp. ASV81]|uniref:HD domain-containing protein n=1 Tax=Microbacterium capsulatum TaxID=3041921 RepID=A0ABU0XCT5_9MICO|nr:HD domain-containing protein [Microbacterium sp. ASV81]MDQ4212893.1 HD domain-containing protein [Microbacterium sp. ASV81]
MKTPADYLEAPSDLAHRAIETARTWLDPRILAHSERSWVFAAALGEQEGLDFDPEILCLSSMLHDLGLAEPFDAHRAPFEQASGAVATIFAAGAGMHPPRARAIAVAIEAHMRDEIDPVRTPEGYLLEAATALDVCGRDLDQWDARLLREVVEQLPRTDFTEQFTHAIHRDAARKPGTAAAALDGSGRIRTGEEIWSTFLRRSAP